MTELDAQVRAADIDRWLTDESARLETQRELLKIRDQVFQTGASGRVAAILLDRYAPPATLRRAA